MTRSASSQSRPAGSTCGGMPTQHGCPGGMTPRAPNVVSTGAVEALGERDDLVRAVARPGARPDQDPLGRVDQRVRIAAAPAWSGSGAAPAVRPVHLGRSRSVGTSR